MNAEVQGNRQERAIAAYLSGISVVQIAIESGVSRSTIYNWIRNQKSEISAKTVPTQKEIMNLKQTC